MRSLSLKALVIGSFAAFAAVGFAPRAGAATFDDVAPILRERCVVCHSGEGAPRGLRLGSLQDLRQGSSRGPVAVAGDPDRSELVRRLRGTSQPRMPMNGPPYLGDAEIGTIAAWIAAGMPAGRAAAPSPTAAASALPAPGEPVTFAHVKPILLKWCASCHARNGKMGPPPENLRLTTLEEVLGGGERVVVVPTSPRGSELVRRVNGQAHPRMPYDGPPYLTDDEVRVITDWVAGGARDERGEKAPIPVGRPVRLHGTMGRGLSLDGMTLNPDPGSPRVLRGYVRVLGTVEADGRIRVSEIRERRLESPGALGGQSVRVEDRPPDRVDDHHGGEGEDDHGGRRRGRGRDDRR